MKLLKRTKAELSYILFEVTRHCNLDCCFCYNHWKGNGVNTEKEGYKDSLKTLKQLFGFARIKHVTFTGGEPLLAERIGELILYCRMKGATVSLITNGNTGSDYDYAQMIRLGVQLFELPVHSFDPKIHDFMTGKIGSWNNSVDSIVQLKKLGGLVVPVIVITKHNAAQIGKTLEYLHSLGFKRIMLNRYNIGGRAVHEPQIVSAGKEELNQAFGQANLTAQRLKLTISSNVCTPHCVVDPAQYGNILFTNCSDDLLHRPLTLSVSGELRFCNHSPTILGNIFHDDFNTIVKNGDTKGSFNHCPDYCVRCIRYEKCRGGCRAAAEQIGGSFKEVDPLVLFNN